MTQLTLSPERRLRTRLDLRATLFLLGTATVAGLIIWVGSFPGAPLDGAVIAFFGVIALLVAAIRLLVRRPRRSSWGVVALSAALIAAALPLAWSGRVFEARYAAGADEFAAVAAQLPEQPVKAGYRRFKPYPGECPRGIGSFSIEQCYTFRGGWLLLDSTSTVSDQAGFYYRPGLSRRDNPKAGLIHLTGDWYSWRQEPMT